MNRSAVALIVVMVCLFAPAAAAQPAGKPADVSDVLAGVIGQHDVPGMVAAVVEGDKVVAIGSAGVRKRGGREKVTPRDLFHIGSCTKAMTATLCAALVEEGKLKWDSTVGQTFPKARVHADYRAVTLEQLLTNRGGVPGDVEPKLWGSLWTLKGTPTQARKTLMDGVLSQPPAAEPGSTSIYSNTGFAVAGHMAETVGKKTWEDLIREKLFKPLDMKTAAFGPPGRRAGKSVTQPWGHKADGTPVAPDNAGADNPVAIAPAGLVHCTVEDWAKFVALHLQAAQGKAKLLKQETFEKMHAPPDGASYAMGWNVGPSPLGDGKAISHAGSNTMWYAVAWILPEKNVAVVVMCNQGGPGGPGEEACDEASGTLIRRRLAERSK